MLGAGEWVWFRPPSLLDGGRKISILQMYGEIGPERFYTAKSIQSKIFVVIFIACDSLSFGN